MLPVSHNESQHGSHCEPKQPRGTEFTLRAKTPAATPAMSPLAVEPTIMPTIIERTAGVSQAVAPSMAPKTAPNRSPSSTLFMHKVLLGLLLDRKSTRLNS